MTLNTNTDIDTAIHSDMTSPSGLWSATGLAAELAGLLDGLLEWLCNAEPTALDDLEAHIARHATAHGGIFAAEEYANGTESIIDTFTSLIDAHHTIIELNDDANRERD